MKYLSKYLLRSEYECPCCGGLPPDLNPPEIDEPYSSFFMTFTDIRREWGKPINITSGYRCPRHNRHVGGVPLSVHQWGLALDLDCEDEDEVEALLKVIESIDFKLRIGTYRHTGTFIHIDRGFRITPRAVRDWHEGARWYR
jgi:uncharacterized protein YcbK (DUF882 family)